MDGFVFTFIASLTGFIITAITSDTFKIKSKVNQPIFKANIKREIPFKAIILLICFAISTIVSAVQYSQQQKEEYAKELDIRLYNSKRDSIIRVEKAKSDSVADLKGQKRTDSTVASITKALAEYNLEYDKKTNTIIKSLNDSLKNIKSRPDPELLHMITKIRDTTNTRFLLDFCFLNSMAPSRYIDLTFYIVLLDKRRIPFFYQKTNPLEKNFSMPTDGNRCIPVYLSQRIISEMGVLEIYTLIKGSFTNNDKSKTYPFETIAAYRRNTKESGSANSYIDSVTRSTIAKAGVKIK